MFLMLSRSLHTINLINQREIPSLNNVLIYQPVTQFINETFCRLENMFFF